MRYSVVKRKIRKLLPTKILVLYHLFLSLIALIILGNASKKMVVIGITGTKGKTTAALILHSVLNSSKAKVGLISTSEIRIGDKIIPKTDHMTIKGRGFVQKKLNQMLKEGCRYVVLEMTSEAIVQHRDFGVKYDSLVFTNLSSEHLVTHKTYEKYRDAKSILFRNHAKGNQKNINDNLIDRYVLLNSDDKEHTYFLKKSKSIISEPVLFGVGDNAKYKLKIEAFDKFLPNIQTNFSFEGDMYSIPLPGEISAKNSVPAIFFAKRYLHMEPKEINEAFSKIKLQGRLEEIDVGQPFKVFCDYAHEPLSIKSSYMALKDYRRREGKVIMIIGAVGGGRWKYNAEEIGQTAASLSDTVIVTNVDPFFDNPKVIIDSIIKGIKKVKGSVYHKEMDRRKAFQKAFSLAKEDDVVIVTGKGSELTMEVNGNSIPWDERMILKEELKSSLSK